MTGQVLIIEPAVTHRILLRAVLMNANYRVATVDDLATAQALLEVDDFDLILLADEIGGDSGYDFCRRLKSQVATAAIPIIMIVPSWSEGGEHAFTVGADDILVHPVDQPALIARARSLIRVKLMQDEMRLRDDTARDLALAAEGFGEAAAEFVSTPVSVVLAADSPAQGRDWAGIIRSGCGAIVDIAQDTSELLSSCATGDVDIIVLDRSLPGSEPLRLIAELRANLATRHTSILFVVRDGEGDMAGLALDLGANDYFVAPVQPGELISRIRAVLKRKRLSDRLRADLRDGLRLSITDTLTGLYNRAYAERHLPKMIDRARKLEQPFALMMLDLDNFKAINDTFGHGVGDAVLRETAGWLRASVRSIDLVARFGGEEFLIAMPNARNDVAARIAERVRVNVTRAGTALPPAAGERQITISAGIAMASADPDEPISHLIARADKALYASKAAGRNCVRFGEAA